ncbi:phosphoethanolamine transferase domain-containing protein [Ramlibacter tataouinensis]|uniref:Candidate membrane protein n=1 Tax=Ramlibacter tataouinensis (strain ATCC BAA-407 / DSM 14655 / LMG 21543 / TTB310) TaxID=365046 RepID=F5Y2R2_RAMTT|nr:phosphoethanolamine transferase domain-containing protein [Ramlibacter tataouinensis]AEG93608.1 Candidate membrane protein [Ramlibacter tataouinensis TTB310]
MLRNPSLKLFRSTGYESILAPGETRMALHPGWMILAVSAWVGFACNVALWRALATGTGLSWAMATGTLVAAAVGTFLSLFGWRRTLKPVASLMVLLAATLACGIWTQSLPVNGQLMGKGASALLPEWTSLLSWQAPTLLVVLALLPLLWVWQKQLRRLPGPTQLAANITGMVTGACVLAGIAFLLAVRPL